MKVSSILKSKGHMVVDVNPAATVLAAAQTLKRQSIGAVVVNSVDGKVEGILSERDIVFALAERGADVLEWLVSELMTSDVVCCEPDDDLDSVMSTMTSRRIRHLPVTENGKLVGIVSIGDAVKSRLQELENEATHLREYINN